MKKKTSAAVLADGGNAHEGARPPLAAHESSETKAHARSARYTAKRSRSPVNSVPPEQHPHPHHPEH